MFQDNISVDFRQQGLFTICMLVDHLSEQIFVGVAKCSPHDKPDETIGNVVSLARAMERRGEYWSEKAYAREPRIGLKPLAKKQLADFEAGRKRMDEPYLSETLINQWQGWMS